MEKIATLNLRNCPKHIRDAVNMLVADQRTRIPGTNQTVLCAVLIEYALAKLSKSQIDLKVNMALVSKKSPKK